jgi:hypothetical protein
VEFEIKISEYLIKTKTLTKALTFLLEGLTKKLIDKHVKEDGSGIF